MAIPWGLSWEEGAATLETEFPLTSILFSNPSPHTEPNHHVHATVFDSLGFLEVETPS